MRGIGPSAQIVVRIMPMGWETIVILIVALGASGLTFFSGFGLGTLLMPAFALFFPVESAVAMTAVVHFANNLFKLGLAGKRADRSVLLRFGLPAIAASFLGAWLLLRLSDFPSVYEYLWMGRTFQVTWVKLVMAAVMIGFALLETLPAARRLEFDAKFLPLGGTLSGFFGGLSGHQGALRSAFLVRSGLTKESFIGTGVAIACLVDLTRLSVYSGHFGRLHSENSWPLIGAATLAAFLGALIGSRLVHKVTIASIRTLVSIFLVVIAIFLAVGVI